MDFTVLDIEKAFDSLWWEDCTNNLYDSLEETNRNNNLSLLHKMNRDNFVGIKTDFGMTERLNIPDITQQGGLWGPTSCSNSIDSVGRKCDE